MAIAPWLIGGIVLISVFALLRSRTSESPLWTYLSAGTGCLLLLAPIITTVLLDILAIWIAPSLVPRTWRRVLIGVSPASGTWLAMVGASLILIGVVHEADRFLSFTRALGRGLFRLQRQSLGAVAAIVGIILAVTARYEPWFTLNFAAVHGSPQSLSIPGYALPIIGLGGLVVASASVALALTAIVRPSAIAGCGLVTAGWLATLPSAIVAIVNAHDYHATVTVPTILRTSLAQWSKDAHRASSGAVTLPTLAKHAVVSLSGAPGAVVTLIGGLLLGGAGILLIKPGHRGELS